MPFNIAQIEGSVLVTPAPYCRRRCSSGVNYRSVSTTAGIPYLLLRPIGTSILVTPLFLHIFTLATTHVRVDILRGVTVIPPSPAMWINDGAVTRTNGGPTWGYSGGNVMYQSYIRDYMPIQIVFQNEEPLDKSVDETFCVGLRSLSGTAQCLIVFGWEEESA